MFKNYLTVEHKPQTLNCLHFLYIASLVHIVTSVFHHDDAARQTPCDGIMTSFFPNFLTFSVKPQNFEGFPGHIGPFTGWVQNNGRTCPTNLAQHPIEKRFLLLHGQATSVENLFVVKPSWLNQNRVTKILFAYSFFCKVIIQHR